MKNLINISYFQISKNGICAADFENRDKEAMINPTQVVVISSLETFKTPLSGKSVAKYATVTVSSGDVFYIREQSYNALMAK